MAAAAAATFDEQFETWLSVRLSTIKDHLAGRRLDAAAADRNIRSKVAMSRRRASPAGNYYRFVYEDDDYDYGNEDDLAPISPVSEEPDDQPPPADTSTDPEPGRRRQRLSRLLGQEALQALDLDLSDSEPSDFRHLENWPGETDENLNRKFGFSFVPRAQDYSTTSLEFSDLESLVSDSVGRRSDNDDEEQQGVWNQTESQGGPVAPPDELRLDREPVGFVEFTPVDENSDKNDAGNNTGHSRQRGSRRRRYDHLVAVSYHRENLNDVDAANAGDFIDDDILLQRFPPPENDVDVTSLPVRAGADRHSRMTSVLPTDVAEMTMDVDDYAACDADTARDRDPIVRVSDPEYYGSSGQSKLMACCCVTPRTACQRRLFILTGLTALLTAAALLAILVYLILTRP